MYYQIIVIQDGQRYYLQGTGRINDVRIALWTSKRIKGKMFIRVEDARTCIKRDRLKNWTIEGPGVREQQ